MIRVRMLEGLLVVDLSKKWALVLRDVEMLQSDNNQQLVNVFGTILGHWSVEAHSKKDVWFNTMMGKFRVWIRGLLKKTL